MISLTSPVKTRAHSWPAFWKLLALFAATLAIFYVETLWAMGLITLAVFILYALPGRVFFVSGLKKLKILWPFLLLICLWHLFTGTTEIGILLVLRILVMVGLANLVTMTTRLDDMIDALKTLSTPLRKLGLKTGKIEIAIALTIRFTPVLIDKGRHLVDAWRARSHRRPGWRVILPFTLLALDDADHIAEALKARGGVNTEET